MSQRSSSAKNVLSLAAALAASLLAVHSASAAADTWNATGGPGDGLTWDTIQLNWNNGVNAFVSGTDSAVFNDANGGNYTINVPNSITTVGITATNTTSAYTISIAPTATLTDTGTVSIGQTAVIANSVINLIGGGTYDQTGGNLSLSGNNALGTAPAGVLNASGLSNFTYNVPTGVMQIASNLNSGNLASGNATRTQGCLTLATGAASSNLLVALAIDVGDSGGGNGGGTSSITLGSGTNTVQSTTIIIGHGKNSGAILGSNGSVTISGTTGGSTTANISIGVGSSGSGTGTTSQLNLDGTNATVQAGTLNVGQLAGNTSGTPSGSLSFDTGTFNVVTGLAVGTATSGNSTGGVKGVLNIGSSSASTGAFNVSGGFLIGNDTDSGTASRTDTASVIINGGIVTSNVDITSNNNKPTTVTISSTLSLLGGTLDMTGHQIGHVTGNNTILSAFNTPVTGKTATLLNLGGTGINDAGLAVNGGGTLFLGGTDPYSNNTNISNNSTLFVDGAYTGTGQMNVAAGSTLGGKGSVGPVSVATAGFLSPGDNSINTLIVGNTTLAGVLNIDLNDADPNVNDLLNANGLILDISPITSAVSFNVTGTLSAPAYIFADYGTLNGSAFSTVAGLPAGYTINYNYNGNNDIALVAGGGTTTTPEPTSLALLTLAAPLFLKRRRK